MATSMGIPTITNTITGTGMGMTGTAMTESLSLSALYRLQTFLSPAFPVGAFTYSHGLEQAVDRGDVTSAAELIPWLEDVLRFGAGRSDAILLKESMRAASGGDAEALAELRALGLALQPSKERHLETSAQGTAFAGAIARSWLPGRSTRAADLCREILAADDDPWPYPVAVGLACAAHDIPDDAALIAWLHAFSANIVSAAMRTVPLGQTESQTVLVRIEPVIFDVAEEAAASGLNDLGTSTFLADIASMAHETQYSRLFRS
ncbi:urease accessory protein UreF [Roseibium sp. AS2]|uniref:urease accessory protein UreF n=1 Tax=Roseibium sp. AS2 TaxID=3135781 RepID=UPI003178DEF3